MFLLFLEGNLFCGPLSRTKCMIFRSKKCHLVQIYREHNRQNAGPNSELRAFCLFPLPCVHSICTVSSSANEILEGCGVMNFIPAGLGSGFEQGLLLMLYHAMNHTGVHPASEAPLLLLPLLISFNLSLTQWGG